MANILTSEEHMAVLFLDLKYASTLIKKSRISHLDITLEYSKKKR